MNYFLFGYDIESPPLYKDVTEKFLDVAPDLHRELSAPCTFFVCGHTADALPERFKKIAKEYSDLIELGQHTYSHIICKDLIQIVSEDIIEGDTGEVWYPKGTLEIKAAPIETIKEEITRTTQIISELSGKPCFSLTTPVGNYGGLSDTPEVLKILQDNGIKCVRSWTRAPNGWFPLPIEHQPYFYKDAGFPEILECPCHDGHLPRRIIGWKKHKEFLDAIKNLIKKIVDKGFDFCYAQHDFDSITDDPSLTLTKEIIKYAKEVGLKPVSYREYYEIKLNSLH